MNDFYRRIAGKTGWVFCEIAFWWFDVLDHPIEDEEWNWFHYITFFAGSIPMVIGCLLYNLSIDEKEK